jgi:hypothetical protein
MPKKVIVLPDSAALRDVYFVPPDDDSNGVSLVVIGSETRRKNAFVDDLVQLGLTDETSDVKAARKRRTLAPTIGAVLRADDIGGWVEAQNTTIPQERGTGELDLRKEKFDPVDDCLGECHFD